MPKKKCIQRVVKASDKKLTQEQAEEILREIEGIIRDREGVEVRYASGEAAQAAFNEIIETLEARKVIDKRRRLMAIESDRDFFNSAKQYKNKADALLASIGKFGRTQAGLEGGRHSVEGMTVALTSAFQGRLEANLKKADLWADFTSNRIDREIANEIQQLSMGKDGKPGITGNAKARRIAKEVHDIMRDLVGKQNEQGADIRMRADYILPQSHDFETLRSLGSKEESRIIWENDILPGLEASSTFKGADKATFLKEAHEALYNNFFDDVKVEEFADGKVDRVVVPQSGKHGSLAKKLGAERVFHFKSADDWLEYNKKYGRHKNFSEAVMADIETRARSIALMKKFTHNPEEAFERRLRGLMAMVRSAPDSDAQLDLLRENMGRQIEQAWKEATGALQSEKTNSFNTFANGLKSVETWSKLGAATLASTPDVFTSAAKLMASMGESQGPISGIKAAIRIMKEVPGGFRAAVGSGAEAAWARVNGVVYDSINASIADRYGSAVTGAGKINELFKSITNAFFKLNFLTWWTDAIRIAAHNAHASLMGEMAGAAIEKLPSGMQADLLEAGITRAEWDAIRGTVQDVDDVGTKMVAADTVSGGDFSEVLRERQLSDTPENRRRVAQDVELKTRMYMENVLEQSVPQPGMEERLITRGYRHQDDKMAGLISVLLQFKTHPITVYNKIIRRAYKRSGANGVADFLMRGGSARNNILMTVAMTTVAGYMSGVSKDLLKGKTPKDFTKTKTWIDAASRGGGLGILGDFLFREYDNHLSKGSSLLVGPAVGGIIDPLAASVSALVHDGDPDKAKASAYRMARDNMPLANLFYIKPIMDQLIWFNLNEFFSPGWERRYEKRVEDAGQEFIDAPFVGEFGNPAE